MLEVRSAEIELSLLAGEHAVHVEGDFQAGRERFDAAYREAARVGDGPGMARAALGLGGLWVHEHRTAAGGAMVRVRQSEALALIDPGSPLGLRLRARLAAEDDYRSGGHAAILTLVDEARDRGDPVALAETLSLAHNCVLGPDHGSLRLELARELIGVASGTGRRVDLLMGLLWYVVDLLLAADPHAERALVELHALSAEDGHRGIDFVRGAIEVMLAIRAGRFEQAEALAAASTERGAAAGDNDAIGWYGLQLAAIRWYQGRIGELVPLLSELLTSPTLSAVDDSPFARLAVAAAGAGDRRLAGSMLARLRTGVLENPVRTSTWLMSMYAIAETADLVADTDTAARVYDLLIPYARLPVMSSPGIACFGSVQHSLGVASITVGEADRAVGHLRAAVHHNLALGHWPAVALSRSRLGQALTLRDGPHDEAARRELALAGQEAVALGMALPTGPASETTGRVVCRRRGRHWQLELGERRALVEHSVGMRHLATLLANPGQEIPAADLAGGAGVPEGPVSAQPVLDEPAIRAYRQRLAQLEAGIEELESGGAYERADAMRGERDWLVAELAAATGLGGRARSFAGSEERARIAVGKAIRRALDRVAKADPVIGDELRHAVHTGMRCSYRPCS
ncbi:hypothetical protein [Nonomuraea cavernae]|uniref:hypothetical protein n=1 Tax=Nonomuraea cavernae TaxID=2045107 RepID=UPI0033CF9B95